MFAVDRNVVRRFTLAFVLSLGLGVGVYAFEELETLAGPALGFVEDLDKEPDLGSCPANFPIEVFVKDNAVDENGDHIICTDDKGKRFVDNDFLGDLDGPGQVTGHGNFFDGGKKILQDISFSFTAMNTGRGSKEFSDAAKGEFEYHDQTPAGPDLTVHGDVVCLSVDLNSAVLIGRVTRSNDFALPVDALVAWRTVDNGEGGSELTTDQVSRPSLIGSKLPKEDSCRIKFPELPATRPILSGNIQVH